ncbi:hypothetical protein ACM66B_004610 [Microbotryomycetes sp. NB124-2]
MGDAVGPQLVGRTQQREFVTSFVRKRYIPSDSSASSPPGTLYVSGPPGSGKTAVLNAVHADLSAAREQADSIDVKKRVRPVMCNCSSILTADHHHAMWSRLATVVDAHLEHADDQKKACTLAEFKSKIRAAGPLLLILDEVDHLEKHNRHADLVQLITLSNEPSSTFTLIGVANSLDLPARRDFQDLLAKHGSDPNKSLKHLHFKAYSAAEMETIVRKRLSRPMTAPTNDSPSMPFTDAALRLCTAKIAALSGDIRTVFGVLRTVLQQLQTQAKDSFESGEARPAPQAGPAHVSRVISAARLNSATSADSLLGSLQASGRVALATICVAWLRGSEAGGTPSMTTDAAYACYSSVLRDEGTLRPLGLSDFVGLCDVLEAAGLLHRSAPAVKARKSRKGLQRQTTTSDAHLTPGSVPLPQLVSVFEAAIPESNPSSPAAAECARICKSIILAEQSRAARSKQRDKFQSVHVTDFDDALGVRGRGGA